MAITSRVQLNEGKIGSGCSRQKEARLKSPLRDDQYYRNIITIGVELVEVRFSISLRTRSRFLLFFFPFVMNGMELIIIYLHHKMSHSTFPRLMRPAKLFCSRPVQLSLMEQDALLLVPDLQPPFCILSCWSKPKRKRNREIKLFREPSRAS